MVKSAEDLLEIKAIDYEGFNIGSTKIMELMIEFAKIHVQAALMSRYNLSQTKYMAGETGYLTLSESIEGYTENIK